ncbi:hypothetical protein C8A00DRAFT_45663 [Chaetomidium leptoderma]|uniref:non-specific serine/threonine protein kinase n=1 Tax=Chaetomidium leptoderma TaxID=669021 RepID=A0AAN6VID8_9PEZI|nr:hypothetical protein C8A00DRAFT_45663 [Chaetomidium leptoderma]
MADYTQSEIIKQNPIGSGLEGFRASYRSVYNSRSLPYVLDTLDQLDDEDLQKLIRAFLRAAQNLPAADLLPATTRRGTLRSDLLRLELSLESDDTNFNRIRPLLKDALADDLDDTLVWSRVYNALQKTSSFAISSEYRQDVDKILRAELGPIYIGIPRFRETYLGGVAGLEAASKAVFHRYTEGSNPLFNKGWFTDLSEKLAELAEGHKLTPTRRRRPLAQPNKPIQGSTAERKLDVGFVDHPEAGKDSRCHWSQILIPGELKSNPSADKASKAGIASERFDINKHGLQFVSTVLGFLWMNDEQLGFDPTITTQDGQRLVTIKRNGQTERLVIDKLVGHREGEPGIRFVIKDAWQYTEREEEGELLREATDKGMVNVARYYHHETVAPGASRKGRSSTASLKRSSSQTGAALPPGKRSCSASPTKANSSALPNRVHRRVILRDYRKPIYKASSPSALLTALKGCIDGHESLHRAGILHRDISVNNLMINEHDDNPSWDSFLIDLDLAIREKRDGTSGARGKTGTRAFMAIGALLGEQHSFMHDLESFFWGEVVAEFDKWNYANTEELAKLKLGTVSDKDIFLNTTEFFTEYYRPLLPCVNELRRAVFPGGGKWKREDDGLYTRMRKVLEKARKALANS